MQESVTDFIKTKRINSFQKLRLLLFLHRHPKMKGTSEDFAERLHFGDRFVVERLIADLEDVGLVRRAGRHYMLNNDEPTIHFQLDELAAAFDHPLSRQHLLDRVKHATVKGYLNGHYSGRQPLTRF